MTSSLSFAGGVGRQWSEPQRTRQLEIERVVKFKKKKRKKEIGFESRIVCESVYCLT